MNDAMDDLIKHAQVPPRDESSGDASFPVTSAEDALPDEIAAGICVRDLLIQTKQSGRRKILLSGVSLNIPRGSFAVILGPSGCGKSTLIRSLGGIQPISQGSVHLAGYPVDVLRRQYPLALGYLAQFGAFHPELTVHEALTNAVALRLPASVPRQVKADWVTHITQLAGIENVLEQPYGTLSGGQMRRAALAEELIGDPAFLLFDELTSGLDEQADREMMLWLRDLAHSYGKTVVLVTHATYHLNLDDSIIFLHSGRCIQHGTLGEILGWHQVASIADLLDLYDEATHAQVGDSLARGISNIEIGNDGGEAAPQEAIVSDVASTPATTSATALKRVMAVASASASAAAHLGPTPTQHIPLKTAKPPGGLRQFPSLVARQARLFWRDKGQLAIQLTLVLTFPAIVAIFATRGLPQVRSLTLTLENNILQTMQEQLLYLRESFKAAALISGLAMFQVVLLTLMGANNSAREIAKERAILDKELRTGLSPAAYVISKFLQIIFLCAAQAGWMTWFVKTLCGFPGNAWEQYAILFATTLAMSATCLAISAYAKTPERASLLSIYLVGFQMPLSGAVLALPDWINGICQPLIAAYWGWSGYLKTFEATRHYDIAKEFTKTAIASYPGSLAVLAIHIILSLAAAVWFVKRRQNQTALPPQ